MTLGGWYVAHQLMEVNGALTWMPWQRRALSIVFDGVRLGEHLVPDAPTRYEDNKLWEQDACARTLVAARMDSLIVDVTTIPEENESTPDFTARLTDGRNIAIEHTRVCSEVDKLIAASLDRTQGRVTERVDAEALPNQRVAFAFPAAPILSDVDDTATEMVRAMRELIRPRGTTRTPFEKSYELLHALGVHWTVTGVGVKAEAKVEPWLLETDARPVAASIFTNVAKKRKKIDDYRRFGASAWLTVWVDVRFCLPTTVLRHIQQDGLEFEPFERIIVGGTTKAVIFDADGPRESSPAR